MTDFATMNLAKLISRKIVKKSQISTLCACVVEQSPQLTRVLVPKVDRFYGALRWYNKKSFGV